MSMKVYTLFPAADPKSTLLPMARLKVDPWNGLTTIPAQVAEIVEAFAHMRANDRALAIDGWLTKRHFSPGEPGLDGKGWPESSIERIVKSFADTRVDLCQDTMDALARLQRGLSGKIFRDLRPHLIDVDDEAFVTPWNEACLPAIRAIFSDASARARFPSPLRTCTVEDVVERRNMDMVLLFDSYSFDLATRTVARYLYTSGVANDNTAISAAWAVRSMPGRQVRDANGHEQKSRVLADGVTGCWQLYFEGAVAGDAGSVWRAMIDDLNRVGACTGPLGCRRFIPTISTPAAIGHPLSATTRLAYATLLAHLGAMGVGRVVLFNPAGDPRDQVAQEELIEEAARDAVVFKQPASVPEFRSDQAVISTGRVTTYRDTFMAAASAS